MQKPITTLFMLTSVDGKISLGENDKLDVDKDFPKIKGVKEGLHQYYQLEKLTDYYSLNSGRTLAKVGVNKWKNVQKTVVKFVVIDNKPHFNLRGVDNMLKRSSKLFFITTNKNHPVFKRQKAENLEIIYFKDKIDFKKVFKDLKEKHGVNRMTIQTGGTLNSIFLREGLIDKISIVVAPVLVGGKDTSALIDGPSLKSIKEINKVRALKLISIKKLKSSYINLKYKVLN